MPPKILTRSTRSRLAVISSHESQQEVSQPIDSQI
ncbi:unnamed protein product, partial [Brachionus calyciflorus]